ncbi:hypothetical protein GXM21_07890 [Megamonas funiformis]|uniref:Type II secretion system protein GspG C-terminal domain-containing protein n=1 Tax=Megamonas funiformis YIT 11815 TaxID=742816 RepID=A0ABP2NM90_9FIRM|nr:type II secretion system protein GspG [Megamonas funiformis]EHR38892.1 hypothetical protein HMPREF9454_00342 [Megamonas funiformis YIT 11815]QIB60315.1 hypothetical protein GXM21_07890 [Megamonas funiformis]
MFVLTSINNQKQRKAFSISELMVYMIVVLFLVGVLFLGLPFLINQAKVITAKQEMDTIKTAVTTYQMMAINPSDSITMDDLKTGLTAEESVDGLSHQNILPEDADLNDPWGGEYLIETSTDGSGSITTSNAVSVGGLESEVTLSW